MNSSSHFAHEWSLGLRVLLLSCCLAEPNFSFQDGFISSHVIAGSKGTNPAIGADVDNDGDIDILSSSKVEGRIFWHENTNGLVSFGGSRTVTGLADSVTSIFAVDFDDDGDVDVLASLSLDDKIVWYENLDGLGTFGLEQLISSQVSRPIYVLAADMDADGDLDALSSSSFDSKIAWYENTDGEGSFGPQKIITTEANTRFGSVVIRVVDIDGDSDLDVFWLASANVTSGMFTIYNNRIAWHENLGGGAYQIHNILQNSSNPDAYLTAEVSDLDGDGDLDFISSRYGSVGGGPNPSITSWNKNTDGLGTFGAEQVITSQVLSCVSISIVDLNDDDHPDVLLADSAGDRLVLFPNINGTGSFGGPLILAADASNVQFASTPDIDGDGDPDVLTVSSADDRISLYENINSSNAFVLQKGVANGVSGLPFSRSVKAADFDGDGNADILAGSTILTWYRNLDGFGNFGEQLTVSTLVNIVLSVDVADLDGDGDIDALSASGSDNKIAWYENQTGIGDFGIQQEINSVGNSATSVYATDVNGDGDQDVLGAFSADDMIVWYANLDGLGAFAPQQVINSLTNNVQSVIARDLDGDGDQDVLSASANGNKIAWYENLDGLGNYGAQQIITTQALDTAFVSAGDLDGDGDQDVLAASDFSNTITWYENTDALGSFGPAQIINSSSFNTAAVVVADLDDDGDQDVIASSINGDHVAWYENVDGLGTFGPRKYVSDNVESSQEIVVADIDGDGDPDVVGIASPPNVGRVTWYENGTYSPVESIQLIRAGSPENPIALLPGVTNGPTLGDLWDPVIDHSTFVPTSILDVFTISLTSANIPTPPSGTILCGPSLLNRFRVPGNALNVSIPADGVLLGLNLCVGGASIDPSLNIFLTNALDITIGSY